MTANSIPTKQKITREFDVKLDGKEREAKADEMALLLGEVADLELEQKESNAAFKTKIDERYKKLGEIGKAVRSGVETRTLEAEMVKDFASATKRFFIGAKMIHEEAMTSNELQMELGDVTEPKSNSPEDLGYKKRKKAKTAADGRLEDAQKAIASKKKGKATTADIVKLETSRKTKRTSVDGVYKT